MAANGGVANWENYNSVLVVIFFNLSLMVIAEYGNILAVNMKYKKEM